MKKVLILFLSISLFTSIDVISQSKKELKKQKEKEEFQETKKLIESGNYVFEADWATSQRGRRVNIAGDGNTMSMKDKKAKGDFPFYGEAYGGAPYGGGGIEFDGDITDFKIKYKDKKNKLTINFKIRHKSENYDVTINVFGSGSSSVQISSNSRSTMSYSGDIKKVKEEKKS